MTDSTEPPEGGNKGAFKKGYDPRRSIGRQAYRDNAGKTLTKLARDNVPGAFQRLLEILYDPKTKSKDVIAAINIVFNRAAGLPSQSVKIDGQIAHAHAHATIDPRQLSAEARQQILRLASFVEVTDAEADPLLITSQPVEGEEPLE
jgi:hypothetical protein